jgi:hypothetical protein
MARTGGNPDLKKHEFKASGEESNNARISFWTSKTMKDQLDSLENRSEFIRQALAKALEELS